MKAENENPPNTDTQKLGQRVDRPTLILWTLVRTLQPLACSLVSGAPGSPESPLVGEVVNGLEQATKDYGCSFND